MEAKITNLLTLAMKSGNLVSGEDTCMAYLKKDAIYLMLIAEDASNNTKKKFQDKASYRSVPIKVWKEKDLLGSIIGKGSRTVVGIIDKGFASSLIKYFDGLT